MSDIQKIDLDKVDWRGSREFFESLGEALDKLDDDDESYDFTWVGKRKAIIEAGSPINKTLRPDVEASREWDTTGNLFIEGDNLDALKLLQESYLGKVKMIYIDPPYNTGKDFIYRDNFKAVEEDYEKDTEYRDDEGNINFKKKNEKTNGRYHSDWLSMMYPRLKLSRNLLSDDGVIFISIGEDEIANVVKLSEEIFGENNFVYILKWKRKKQPSYLHGHVAGVVEYIVVVAKNSDSLEKLSIDSKSDETSRLDNGSNDSVVRTFGPGVKVKTNLSFIKKGVYKIKTSSVEYLDDIEIKNGRTVSKVDVRARFRNSQEQINDFIREDLLFITTNLGLRRDNSEADKGKRKMITDLLLDWGDNQESDKEINNLFPEGKPFDYPKPTKLIYNLTKSNIGSDFIVLDFFSGSGTTAHAVMQLNAVDGGSRKHIQVQLPEKTDEKSEAFKAGYKSIPEIARERIRRAGDKIKEDFKDELSERESPLDLGFRVLTITDTNYKEVHAPAGSAQQLNLDDDVNNIKDDRSDLDLLFGVLTQLALELNGPIEKQVIADSEVYLYDYFDKSSGLIACFAENVSEDAVKEIANLKPLTAVFRDSSFSNSQAKVNLSEHFRIISPDTKVKVI